MKLLLPMSLAITSALASAAHAQDPDAPLQRWDHCISDRAEMAECVGSFADRCIEMFVEVNYNESVARSRCYAEEASLWANEMRELYYRIRQVFLDEPEGTAQLPPQMEGESRAVLFMEADAAWTRYVEKQCAVRFSSLQGEVEPAERYAARELCIRDLTASRTIDLHRTLDPER